MKTKTKKKRSRPEDDKILELDDDALGKFLVLRTPDGEDYVTVEEALAELQKGRTADQRLRDLAAEKSTHAADLEAALLIKKGLTEQDMGAFRQGIRAWGISDEQLQQHQQRHPQKNQDDDRDDSRRKSRRDKDLDEYDTEELVEEVTSALDGRIAGLEDAVRTIIKRFQDQDTASKTEKTRTERRTAIRNVLDRDDRFSKLMADEGSSTILLEDVERSVARRTGTTEFPSFSERVIRAGIEDYVARQKAIGASFGEDADDRPPNMGVGSTGQPVTDSIHLSPASQALISNVKRSSRPSKEDDAKPGSFLADLVSEMQKGGAQDKT